MEVPMAFRSPARPALGLPEPERMTEALDQADFTRNRRGLGLSAAICLSVVTILQVGSPRSTLHWIATAMLVLGGLASLALRYHLGKRGHDEDVDMLAIGTLLTFVTLVVLAYVGPFSAGVAALCLLVFFYGSASNDLKGLTVYVSSACGYVALTIAALSGMIDPAAGPIGTISTTRGLVLLSLVVQGLLLASFYAARTNRRLYVEAVERMSDARHQLRRNEVELVRVRAHAHPDDEAVFGRLSGLSLGRYRLGEVIGRGGMGEVYRAIDDEGGHPVAVKVLTESMRDDPVQVERFFREAQVSSELDSPHIVKILDAAWSEDGRYPYLAMELLEGQDLGSHLRKRGPLSLRDVVDLVHDVAEALSCAHAVGIVHRDMKPENVFLAHGPEGARWKVLDFGISKMRDSRGTLTKNGVIGTPNYMSPEQAQGGALDMRTDIFALGAIVYRVLTGRMAFDAGEPLAALLQVMNEMPIDPAELCTIPHDVELALAIALAKDKHERYGCARDFAEAFRAAARSELSEGLRRRALELLRAQPWTPCEAVCTKRPSELDELVGRSTPRSLPARDPLPIDTPAIAVKPHREREATLPEQALVSAPWSTSSDTASLADLDVAWVIDEPTPSPCEAGQPEETPYPPPRQSHTRARIPAPHPAPEHTTVRPPSQPPVRLRRRGAFVEDDTLPLEDLFPQSSGGWA
jgi:serine/threonine-protein kinase